MPQFGKLLSRQNLIFPPPFLLIYMYSDDLYKQVVKVI